jgi:PIN domain nuclease of toxin-antitoxin system
VGPVKLLLDTCAFLWLAAEPDRLSQKAAEAIDDQANGVFISDVTLWEISLKHLAGKLPLPESPRRWTAKQIEFFGLQSLPIDADSIFRSVELPTEHRDPFDRLLAAQAIGGSLRFLTIDPIFAELKVDCLW